MRYSTLAERESFYKDEFDLGAVQAWFDRGLEGIVFAVIIGRHTGIAPQEYLEDAKVTILIDDYKNLKDVRRRLIEFRPESVYYDRNVYAADGSVRGQELAFDLDPENLLTEAELEDRMEHHQGLSFSAEMLERIREETKSLYAKLEGTFDDMRIVYSGRGYHIHVVDEDAFGMGRAERGRLARRLKREGAPIDPWVTTGGSRLIRLPHSLHGMVSRIVIPLKVGELEGFDPLTDQRCLPLFIRST